MRIAAIFVVAMVCWIPCYAQESSPPDVEPAYVLSVAGDEIRGQLLQLTPDRMAMLVSGLRRELPLESVLRIQVGRDSVKNGALIGGTIGFLWCALVCGQGLDDDSQYLPVILANTGMFALIGMAFDLSIDGRTTIYRKPPSAPSRGIGFRFRF